MRAPIRTFTRDEIDAALTAADRIDLGACVYSRPLSLWDAAGYYSLAFAFDELADLATFMVVMAGLLGSDAQDFAEATRQEQIGSTSSVIAYWPRFLLDEQLVSDVEPEPAGVAS